MTNTDKSKIIMELAEEMYKKNKRKNSKKELTDIFNAWMNSSKYKISDIDKEFLSWILNYIEELIKMDKDLIKEVVQLEKT